MPNRLINESSPYLLQHAENPVDWYPWGQEALDKARLEDKPIFLSIGYAACHWCHVMAHESFEDPLIAAIMNEHFVNIKVDREERPDLDNIYMNAIVAMTGQGGWPLSVFLTPEGQPFFGGTYFPPVPRYNMPSFREVLLSVHRAWTKEREQILDSSQKIAAYLRDLSNITTPATELSLASLERAALNLAQTYDWEFGGWGKAPKFPQPMAIEFLLLRAIDGDRFAQDIAIHALLSMARGGMYDLVGGGFSRYSTDNEWLIPHFEKMLYDNALLSRVYLHAYLITGGENFREVCEETLDFILRELRHPQGGFFSSLDADSEGEEGKYYLWTPAQIRQALPDPLEADLALTAFNVTEKGNFDGSNVLQRALDDQTLAARFNLSEGEIGQRLKTLRRRLLQARQQRVRPATDDKIITVWNALTLISLSEAARYLKRPDYYQAARDNARFLLEQLYTGERLLRTWRDGRARHNAYLEDYAALILALLSLYQADSDVQWFRAASHLTEEMLAHFSDERGGFFDTRDDHDTPLTRPKDLQDNATPCGNSLAAKALLQMAAYTGRIQWRDKAWAMFGLIQQMAGRYPTAFANWLCAMDFALNPVQEVAILGASADPRTQALADVIWEKYRPRLISACSDLPLPEGCPPLLEGRNLQNHLPTAFVCQNFVCHQPVNNPEEMRSLLDRRL